MRRITPTLAAGLTIALLAVPVARADTGDEPLRILVAQNRLVKYLGYDNVVYFEDGPELTAVTKETVAAST